MSETHFVQTCDGPILVGGGLGVGDRLIQGFDAARFLAIGFRCGRCSMVTTTARLPDGQLPPRSAILAAPSPDPAVTAMTVPPGVSVVGQAEMGFSPLPTAITGARTWCGSAGNFVAGS